jgi:hypothetical protein
LHAAGTALGAVSAGECNVAHSLSRLPPPDPLTLPGNLEGYNGWARAASLRSAGQAIFGGDWREALSYCLYVAIESIRPFYGQEEPPTPLAIRFPVGNGMSGAAAFWLQVVRICAGWTTTLPNCVWSFEPGRASVTIFFGPMPGSAFVDLWEPSPDSDSLSDLVRPRLPASDLLGAVRADVSELLMHEEATVNDLLLTLAGQSAGPASQVR